MMPQRSELKHLELERRSQQLEIENLALERDKAKWISVSVFVPAMAAILTFGLGIWSQRQQAQSQFEIKAAELVLKAGSVAEAKANAAALVALFGDRLPPDFGKTFDEEKLEAFGADIVAAKTELLKLFSDRGMKCEQKLAAIDLWKQLFPDDKTFKHEFKCKDAT
ncbi:MAG TPA: hypothetical protein VNU71_03565 [Burkholderiaceae bacterium]|nr:hypothetical protein [Burkholderiaceae bacterium]